MSLNADGNTAVTACLWQQLADCSMHVMLLTVVITVYLLLLNTHWIKGDFRVNSHSLVPVVALHQGTPYHIWPLYLSYFDGKTALAACVLKKVVNFFWGKKCIQVTWLEDFPTSKWPGSFTAPAPPLSSAVYSARTMHNSTFCETVKENGRVKHLDEPTYHSSSRHFGPRRWRFHHKQETMTTNTHRWDKQIPSLSSCCLLQTKRKNKTIVINYI